MPATSTAPGAIAALWRNGAWTSDASSIADAVGVRPGLALVGPDVGTPIISFHRPDGRGVASFGPVITKTPAHADGLALWDAFVTVTSLQEFWEIKRTRTARPEFGDAP